MADILDSQLATLLYILVLFQTDVARVPGFEVDETHCCRVFGRSSLIERVL